MKIMTAKATATHIISGFLGAGKTTVLQHLLKQKPAHERWAVLMNEFGQIGVDQLLLPQQDNFQVKEVLGGCLCCTSQLPLQIALARLLNEYKPDRLFIEPTGLGHPAQLLQQLTEPHWQSSLNMRILLTVIDGSRITDQQWSQHSVYQDQIKAAQMVLVSHQDLMQAQDHAALAQLQQEYAEYAQQWLPIRHGQIDLAQIDVAYQAPQRQMRPLLRYAQQQTGKSSVDATEQNAAITQLPYHYVEQAQGYAVAGWRFPKHWQFEQAALLDLFCAQQQYLRLKAIIYTNLGWLYFNCNPEQFNYKSGDANFDNRLEIIYEQPQQQPQQWQQFEADLLAIRCDAFAAIDSA